MVTHVCGVNTYAESLHSVEYEHFMNYILGIFTITADLIFTFREVLLISDICAK